jgi:hypothetical protein
MRHNGPVLFGLSKVIHYYCCWESNNQFKYYISCVMVLFVWWARTLCARAHTHTKLVEFHYCPCWNVVPTRMWRMLLTTILMLIGKCKHHAYALEPGWSSRYSDWLWAGRPKGRRSSLDRAKNFPFSTSSRPVLGPAQPLIQWVPRGSFPGDKTAVSWNWPLTSH